MLRKPGTSASFTQVHHHILALKPLFSLSTATALIASSITSMASKINGFDLGYEAESPGDLENPSVCPRSSRSPGLAWGQCCGPVLSSGQGVQDSRSVLQAQLPGPVLSSHFLSSGQGSQANTPNVPARRLQATSPANGTLGAKTDASSQALPHTELYKAEHLLEHSKQALKHAFIAFQNVFKAISSGEYFKNRKGS